jgi:LPS-assembly protein
VYVPRPSAAPRELPQFDTELPTTRLLPIEFPDYNTIDSIDAQNVLRLSLYNKVQTKRADGISDLVNWALYSDWRITRYRDQGTFSDLYSDLDLQPFSWLLLNSETRYNINDRNWTEANHTLTLSPNTTWNFSVGHRYLRDNPAFGTNSGNNIIFTSLFYRFNENWGVRTSHHFEARDGVMEEQYYTLYHDLRSWTGALTFRIRENRTGPTDYTVAVTMSLKAFPRFGVGEDAVRPERLLGY